MYRISLKTVQYTIMLNPSKVRPAPKKDSIEFIQKIRLGKAARFGVIANARTLFRVTRIKTSAPCAGFCYLKLRIGNVIVLNSTSGEVDAFTPIELLSQYSIVDPTSVITCDIRYTGKMHAPPPPAEVLLTITIEGEVVASSVTQQRRWQRDGRSK